MVELLRTKLFTPRPRKNLVLRPRLVDRLNTGLNKKLALVAAPAGFGKTTLLSEWIPQSPRCVTWLSLDEGDNDPTKFWAYFIKSLQELQTDIGAKAFSLLQSPQAPPINSILTSLINDITAFSDSLVVVLDDYHVIDTSTIHSALTFLIEHSPPNMHLILTTRMDPRLPLSRWRAHDELTELRANDLRFTADETAAFLNQAMGLNLSVAEVSALEARTEGWIAGLQIAALSMQGHEDASRFIQAFSGSNRHILGYLAEEVLSKQSDSTQKFLLRTSILDRLCGSLCDAVTGAAGGQTILENLEHANLFIIPLDGEGKWYRYHHLFAEVLRAHLQKTKPDLMQELHRRASAWYEQDALMVEAINHALEAEDYERAMRLIEPIGIAAFFGSTMLYNVQAWLAKLPDSALRSQPKICLIHAWLLLNQGSLANALSRLDEAELALQRVRTAETAAEDQNTYGEIEATRAILFTSKPEFDTEQVIGWAQAALAALDPDNQIFRSAALGALGLAYLSLGELREAERSLADSAGIAQAGGVVYMTIAAVANLAHIQRARGDLRAAETTCQYCLDWLTERGVSSWPSAAVVHANLAACYYEINDLNKALYHANRSVELTDQGANPPITLISLLALARVKEAQYDWDDLARLLQQLEQLPRQAYGHWLTTHWSSIRAHFYLAEGNSSSAFALLRDNDVSFSFTRPLDLLWDCEYDWIAPAQTLIAQGRNSKDVSGFTEALAYLEEMLPKVELLGLVWVQVKTHLLRALTYASLSHASQAQTCLERALTLAQPEGYIRVFVDEGDPMLQLLFDYQAFIKKKMSDGVDGESLRLLRHTDELLASFSQPATVGKLKLETIPEPVSERELDILRLIATGRTNQEIAGILVIAVSTVKSHINSLYGKVGARNRVEAIARARELGILSD
ncbi:MAG TPA: LuxR C-terminal-related transcriptional regulator [Anaerolineales bacterium]|nr:LuxR C-terminal-related transcriptional regulator [Anaerolineales bacterium]